MVFNLWQNTDEFKNQYPMQKGAAISGKKAGVLAVSEEEILIRSLIEARNEWIDAVESFEHAYEEELVDYFTYKVKACEARYSYFLKKARESGLKLSLPETGKAL